MNKKTNPTHCSVPRLLFACLLGLGCAATAYAGPVSYATAGGVHEEGFNQNLPAGAATLTWTQGQIFPGWYAQYTESAANPVPEYRRTFGQSDGIRIYQWRASGTATNGALGAIPINSTGDVHFALALTNNTGQTLTQFNLGYTGQQWRVTTSGPTTITVSYQTGNLASDLTAGTWTGINALTFTSPHSNAAENTNLGGTLVANSEVFAPASISSLNWENGQQLWLRFTVENISGLSQGLAVDDVTFTAIPEPGSSAWIFGMLGLGATLCGRRGRR